MKGPWSGLTKGVPPICSCSIYHRLSQLPLNSVIVKLDPICVIQILHNNLLKGRGDFSRTDEACGTAVCLKFHTPWSHLPPPAPLFYLPRTRPSLLFTPAPFLQPLNPTWLVLLVWPYPWLVQVTMAIVMSRTQHFTTLLLDLQLYLLSFPSSTMPSNPWWGRGCW